VIKDSVLLDIPFETACEGVVMLQQFVRKTGFSIVAIAMAVGFFSNAHGASRVVWQIGVFNGSSTEFNERRPTSPFIGLDYPKTEPVYTIGKSNPKTDWLAFQPGSANADAGCQPHPYTIQFDLQDNPRGVYSLKVALLVETPQVPSLEVNINGHRGLFYQHPRLDRKAGDWASFMPGYSSDTIEFGFPATFLFKGTNTLILTAIDDPAVEFDPKAIPNLGEEPGIVYDALEMDHDPDASFAAGKVSTSVVASMYYKLEGGRLREAVDIFVRFGEHPADGRVTLTLGKERLAERLETDREFGEQKLEFAVPEFTSPRKYEVAISMNGYSHVFSGELVPAKKWTLFVVPLAHLDVGYTDFQPKVAEINSRNVDEIVDMVHQHPEFRFSLDGSWIAEQFLAGRSEDQRKRFLDLVKQGKVFLPAQNALLLTGLPSLETLIRSLYYSREFYRQYGGHFDYANMTDVPSYSWSYASVMAAAGLKYFVTAANQDRAPIFFHGHLDEKSPFWWEGPDGKRIFMWYGRTYAQVEHIFGMPPKVAFGHDCIPILLQNFTRPDYKSDAILIYGSQDENNDLLPQQTTLMNDWNKLYAYPLIRFSGFAEAAGYIARQFGDALPVQRGDGGPYWEDGAGSDAYYSALERENEQRALSAEKFATISSLVNCRVLPDRSAMERLWQNMVLMDEHTWDSDRGISDPESQESIRQSVIKDSYAGQANRLIDYLLGRGLDAISDFIYQPSGTLVVFNSLSWKRSGLMEVDLDNGLEVVDLTSDQTVPFEVLHSGHAFKHIRFLATDIPSVGYKCYSLRPTHFERPIPQVASDTVIENAYYRVTLDPESGAVKGIFDKELNKDLVDSASPYRFDQYLYATGADEHPNRLVQYSSAYPVPKFKVHASEEGRLLSVSKEPFGSVARLESSGLYTPRVTAEIILLDAKKEIIFINHVRKTKVYTKEGVYFAFPFSMDQPQFQYEIQNGLVDPARDQLPGADKEWFTVQHWVAARQGDTAVALVPIDAPLVTLGDIVRGTWPSEFGRRKGTIFSYIMNNYWSTNIQGGQGGEFTFRYVLTSGKRLDPDRLSRWGWESMTPLEVNEIRWQEKAANWPRPLHRAEASFLEVDQPNIVLDNWKRAEDGSGTILRFVETAGSAGTAHVRVPVLSIRAAWTCTAVEENQQSVPASSQSFSFPYTPFAIVTVRIEGEPLERMP